MEAMTPKMKPVKRMKLAKAWALVLKRSGGITYLNLLQTEEAAIRCCKSDERIARVEIREISR